MFIQRYRTSFVTASSAASVTVPSTSTSNLGVINGIVDTIIYYKDGTAPPTTTANFLITVENTSQVILNRTSIANESSFEHVPVRQTNTVAGTTLAVATIGAVGFPVCNSRLIISLSTAGDAKTGIFDVIVR